MVKYYSGTRVLLVVLIPEKLWSKNSVIIDLPIFVVINTSPSKDFSSICDGHGVTDGDHGHKITEDALFDYSSHSHWTTGRFYT